MGSTKVSAPPARDYGQETKDTLRAQIDLAPELYAAEAAYRPGYTQLDLAQLEQALLGGPERTNTTSRTVNDLTPAGWYDQSGKLVSGDPQYRDPMARTGQQTNLEWRNQVATPRTISESSVTPATRGLISIYDEVIPRLGEIETADQARRIGGEMDIIGHYGPEVTARLREAAGNAKLIAELNRQAEEELALGATLDPSLRREVAQSIRSGQSARGLGLGPGDVAEESYATGLRAEQLRRQRQAFAMQVAGMDQATGGDPFLALLGRPSAAFNSAQGMGAQGQSLSTGGNRLFNPESAYASDVYNTNYNAEAAARIGSANNKSAMIGAGISAVGSIAGAAIGGVLA